MQSEFYLPHDYPNEPRLRDLPRTPRNWARIASAGFNSFISNDSFAWPARRDVSFLSVLFALWLSSHLQTWRVERFGDGRLARASL